MCVELNREREKRIDVFPTDNRRERRKAKKADRERE